MAGHSKWAQIKHKKAITDARRGAAWTKLANAIAVAAKQGGGDPEKNFRLRLAIQKAKEDNVPSANIDRSIKRGLGELGGQIEEIMYEGYGPGGVAIMVEAATDNRNRTASEVRSAFTKHNGSLGSPGSVSFQFEQKGQMFIKTKDLEQVSLDAIEAEADDVFEEEDGVRVYTSPTSFEAVKKSLDEKYEVTDAELVLAPKQTAKVNDAKTVGQAIKLLEALDELEDVTATHSNMDIAPEVMEQL